MMPVAPPPNAVVFGTGHLYMRDMLRAGIVLNLLSFVLVSLYCLFMVQVIFLD